MKNVVLFQACDLKYKCFDENNSDYWIERLKANEPGIEILFKEYFNKLQESSSVMDCCKDCCENCGGCGEMN